MKTHNVIQGTPEWLALRAGIPTASELDQLITPGGKLRDWDSEKSKMPKTYLARKLAERWLGYPLESFSGGAMEQGTILEEEAVPWYETTYRMDLQRPGFITTDDGTFGCSPDAIGTQQEVEGVCGSHSYGLEIKCPEPTNHVKWLIENDCPDDHVLQCQGGMYVTDFDEWLFVSYRRSPFPKLVVPVRRDEKLQKVIAQALMIFGEKMESAWELIVRANGGPPQQNKRRARVVEEPGPPLIGLETPEELAGVRAPNFEANL